ncbi:MAG: RHS repeat-associated core domain-containing protein, partial [Hyphomicrobium sp.]
VTAWAVEWLPWGGVHAISGSETLNARFPGQWFQVESGLHYNWHRHYDPTIGRYTQPDPLGFVDGPSVYAYARNAPGQWIDPFGLQTPEPPKPPVVIDPRTGEQVYPPKPPGPTTPGTTAPDPLPPQPPATSRAICEIILADCLAKCNRSPLCQLPYGIGFAYRAQCVARCGFRYNACVMGTLGQ